MKNESRRPLLLRKSFQLKIATLMSVAVMVFSCAVVLAGTGSSDADSGSARDPNTAYETTVVYEPGSPTLTGTYNDTTVPENRSVTYYGNVISTEYNPQVWDYGTKWYGINTYSSGNTAVFIGWKYSSDNVNWTSETYDPGDVLRFENDGWYIGNTATKLCGKDSTIYIQAQWDKIDTIRYSSGSSSTGFNSGSAYTNFYLVDSDKTISSGSNCTIRASSAPSTYLLKMPTASFSGKIIIDNVRVNICQKNLGNWHGDGGTGIYANGNTLIFGDGISPVFTKDMYSNSSYKLGTIYGGSTSYTESTKLILHSGIYSAVVGGGSNVTNDTYVVVNGATITDTLLGASHGYGTVSGDAWVFATGLNMPGDYYEEHALDSGYAGITDSAEYTYQSYESSIFTGGSNNGSVTNTHIYLSGESSVWDLQGGGRRDSSTVSGTANIEISGRAMIKHVVNGSITDGNNTDTNKSCVKNVNITVTGDSKVASVYGAGFDTFYEAKSTSMMGADSTITINIKDGTVGYVYGGGYRGTIGTTSAPLKSIAINVSGGTILYDVFGGGRGGVDKTCHDPSGNNTWSESSNDYTGHSEVYVNSLKITVNGGTIKGNVYGGGESVPWMTDYIDSYSKGGSFSVRSDVASTHLGSSGSLTIDLTGGTVEGSVYGAGKGITSETKYVPYIIAMNSSSTIINIPWLSGNTGDNYTDTSKSSNYLEYAKVEGKISVNVGSGVVVGGSVYGGGAYGKMSGDSANVTIGGTVGNGTSGGNVYGGGQGLVTTNSSLLGVGQVEANTNVTVLAGGEVKGNVYGGGAYGYVTESTSITVSGKVLSDVYGGGQGTATNTSTFDFGKVTNNTSVTVSTSGAVNGNVYGGGAYGRVLGSTSVEAQGTIGKNVYGGGMGSSTNTNTGFVQTVTKVIIGGQVDGNVYGGGAYGNVNASGTLPVTIENSATVGGDVYGGGFGLESDTVRNYGRVNSNTLVTVNGIVEGSTYGGGAYGIVPASSVYINGTVKTDVYGGGVGVLDYSSVTKGSSVELSNGTVGGDVYGAAKFGKVNSASVKISSGTVNGSVYGAGLGEAGHVSVESDVIVEMSAGTVKGSLFGGSKLATVEGNITITVSGGTIEGTLYGGGYGTVNYRSVSGVRKIHIYNGSTIKGSLYGGSSRGDDGISTSSASHANIFIESGTIRGSVFGGGFQGRTYGDTYIGIGTNTSGHLSGFTPMQTGTGNIAIGESVYLGGDVGQVSSDFKPYSDTLVYGKGYLYIDNTGSNIHLNGSVMGSGNSCKTGGETTVEITGFTDTLELEAIHRVTKLTIDQSSISMDGRSTVDENGSQLIMSTLYSLYGIDSFILKNASTVTIRAQVENIKEYSSVNVDGNPTLENSPMNKIIIGDGSTLSFRSITTTGGSDTVTYSSIKGYTIVSVDGSESGFGGFILGSNASLGGFVVQSKGSFSKMDSFDPQTGCRCWFLSGTVSNNLSLTVSSVTPAETSLGLPKFHTSTVYRYTGGVFVTSSPGEGYAMVQTENPALNQFSLFLGYPKTGVSYNQLTFGTGVYLKDYSDGVDPVNGTLGSTDGIPTLALKAYGNFTSSKYIGYVIIYISECSKLEYIDQTGAKIETYVAVNNIQTVVNIYSEGTLADEATVNLPIVDGSGSEILMLPKGKPGYTIEVTGVVPDPDNKNDSVTKLYVEPVKNQDNTLGWTDSLGEKAFHLNGTINNGLIGTMQGGYVSTLKFSIKDYPSEESEKYIVTLVLKKPDGTVDSTIKVTITISKVPDVHVTFKDIVQGDGSKLSLTYAFSFGSTISKEDCPPGGQNFIGWYTDAGFNNPYNYSTPLTKDLTLYPRYMYVVILDYMDGTTSTVYVSTDVGIIGKIDEPTRDGYVFHGWFRDEAHTGASWDLESDKVDGDMTLYAYWVGVTVEVRFYVQTSTGTYEQLKDGDDPVLGKVQFGNRFGTSAKLDNAQSIFEKKYSGTKFIYWVYKSDIEHAGEKQYAVYSSTYLSDYSKLVQETTTYYVDLVAHTSSVAIKVVLDVSNVGDNTAEVEPPSEFLMFPIYTYIDNPSKFPSGTESGYIFEVPLNGATRLGYELSGWKLVNGSNPPVFSAGSDVTICIWKDTSGGYHAKFSVGETEYTMILTEDDYKKVTGEYTESGKVVPYEVKFTSEWRQIPYTITIAKNNFGTIIATYVKDGKTVVLNGSATFYYGQMISLTFEANAGFQFEQWSATGEGTFIDTGSSRTDFVVRSDSTISAYVYGPQIVKINVQYKSSDNLVANRDLIPALVLESSDKTRTQLSVTSVSLVGDEYLVTYSGTVNLGDYRAYLLGAKYQASYDTGITITSSTSTNEYYIMAEPPSGAVSGHSYTGKVVLVKNSITDEDSGILDLTELLLKYSGNGVSKDETELKIKLNGGYYNYLDNDNNPINDTSGNPIKSESSESGWFVRGDYGTITSWEGKIVKQKHSVYIDYVYNSSPLGDLYAGDVGYGELYWALISEHGTYTKDGVEYSVSSWTLNGVEVDSTTVCDKVGTEVIRITANMSKTTSRSVSVTIEQQNTDNDRYTIYGAALTAYALEDGSFNYQLPVYDGFVIKSGVFTGYTITTDGMLTNVSAGVSDITVQYDRKTVTIKVYEYESGTPYTGGTYVEKTVRYGGSLDLSRPADTVDKHWGSWELYGLSGRITDDIYTVTLQDVNSTGDKAIAIAWSTQAYKLTVHTQNGKIQQTVDGTTTEKEVFVIEVLYGSTISVSDRTVTVTGSDGKAYTFVLSTDGVSGYTFNGWVSSDGTTTQDVSTSVQMTTNLLLTVKWTVITYKVTITTDEHLTNLSAEIGSTPCTPTKTDYTYEISDVGYGSWLTISVVFGSGYTLDVSKLQPDTAKYTRGSTLQSYTISLYVQGNTDVVIYSLQTDGKIEIICDGKLIKTLTGTDGVQIEQPFNLKLADLNQWIEDAKFDMTGKFTDGWYVNNSPLYYVETNKEFNITNVPTEGVKVYCYLVPIKITGINELWDGNVHSVTVDFNSKNKYDKDKLVTKYSNDGGATYPYTEIKVTEVNDLLNNKDYKYRITVTKAYPTSGTTSADSGESWVFEGTVGVYLYPASLQIIGNSTTVSLKDVPSSLDDLKGYIVVNGTDQTLEKMGVGLKITFDIYDKDDQKKTSLDSIGVYTLKLSHYELTYNGTTYFDPAATDCPFKVNVVTGNITVNKTGYSSVIV